MKFHNFGQVKRTSNKKYIYEKKKLILAVNIVA